MNPLLTLTLYLGIAAIVVLLVALFLTFKWDLRRISRELKGRFDHEVEVRRYVSPASKIQLAHASVAPAPAVRPATTGNLFSTSGGLEFNQSGPVPPEGITPPNQDMIPLESLADKIFGMSPETPDTGYEAPIREIPVSEIAVIRGEPQMVEAYFADTSQASVEDLEEASTGIIQEYAESSAQSAEELEEAVTGLIQEEEDNVPEFEEDLEESVTGLIESSDDPEESVTGIMSEDVSIPEQVSEELDSSVNVPVPSTGIQFGEVLTSLKD